MKTENQSGELTLIQMAQQFSTDEKAREYFEQLRWPNGPVCPHCGNTDAARIYKVTENRENKIRPGLYKCADCREGFTVTINTVMEDSHIPLHKWLLAFYMMCASKTQVSALQLQRQLEIGSYRSAWFLCHRIRYALKDATPTDQLTGTIEADETYIGGKSRRSRNKTGFENKTAVVSLVQRHGQVRSFAVPVVSSKTIKKVLEENISKSAKLMTDELRAYTIVGREFSSHEVVNHSKLEYVRGNVTTNTVEGYFGLLKRGINGTFHHISRQHLKRYLAEFDFRYNLRKLTDAEIAPLILKGFEGKRLTYKGIN